jgi:hypothetical protein
VGNAATLAPEDEAGDFPVDLLRLLSKGGVPDRLEDYMPELEHHIQVVTPADGALLNVRDDSGYTRRKGEQ